MTETEKQQRRQWLDNWKEASIVLEELRVKAIRESDVVTSLPAFDGLLESALWLEPNSPTSGLVELQKILARKNK